MSRRFDALSGILKSLFLAGTDDERSLSHLHHPSEKEQFFLAEEAITQIALACTTSPDKSSTHMDG